MFWTILGKLDERFVNRRARKNLAAIGRACRHKIDGRVDKNVSSRPSRRDRGVSALIERRYNFSLSRASNFSWMLSNPPLLKTATMSLSFNKGTIRPTIASAFFS